jgi:hypothetical protein
MSLCVCHENKTDKKEEFDGYGVCKNEKKNKV